MGKKFVTTQELEEELKKAAKRVAKRAKEQFLEPTSTWNHTPEFTISEPTIHNGDAEISVKTEDGPYNYLDFGTAVRKAIMTNPFEPKTTPGTFIPSSGVGGMAFVSNNSNKWKPGIEARGWSDMVAQQMDNELYDEIDKIMNEMTTKRSIFYLIKQAIKGVIDRDG